MGTTAKLYVWNGSPGPVYKVGSNAIFGRHPNAYVRGQACELKKYLIGTISFSHLARGLDVSFGPKVIKFF